MDNYNGMAKTFEKIDEPDSGIFYANKVLEVSEFSHYPIVKLDALTLLAKIKK